jgi:hypothetical protein
VVKNATMAGRRHFLPLPDDILHWLDETLPSSDPLDISVIVSRVVARLRERGDAEKIEDTMRILAPLDFWAGKPKQGPWNSYFSPRLNGEDGREEYPIVLLTAIRPEALRIWAEKAPEGAS